MSTGIFVAVYIALLGIFYALSAYMEKSAAMRGSHRKPMSPWIDKGLRLFFLTILVSPLCFAIPWTIVLVLLYIPSFIDGSEKRGDRVSAWLTSWRVFHWVKWYFTLEIVTPHGKLDPKRLYVVAVHPHGFLPLGTLINMLSEVNNIREKWLNGVKLRTLAASFCFYIPGYRDFCLGGGVIDAARYNAKRALTNGCSIALVPGGATEALYAGPGHNTLVLKNRRGFIKLALEVGADLVPVYSFGENDCYNQAASVFPWLKRVQAKFQKVFGLSLPMVTHVIPKPVKITTVMGKPIPVKKVENPSDAEVDALLTLYIEKITEHFYAHCDKYIVDPKHRKLEIL
ncbi:diacylglycerol acyltransferase, putative [Bodo saltans]|uniref:Acyltransferase n=1 Tax=Bodo saltans TaxID=75058 RepID=A0A0S4J1B8_BODSA|nr:diacylglycerol acyltransferase, putative [Bodo saltans]|eukprot:CUG47678.1 diacylglycerol acyltransferase, putative [Bodo saltans]